MSLGGKKMESSMKKFGMIILIFGLLIVTKIAWAAPNNHDNNGRKGNFGFGWDESSWFKGFDKSWFGDFQRGKNDHGWWDGEDFAKFHKPGWHREGNEGGHEGGHNGGHGGGCPVAPEPVSSALFLLGSGALAAARKLRNKKA